MTPIMTLTIQAPQHAVEAKNHSSSSESELPSACADAFSPIIISDMANIEHRRIAVNTKTLALPNDIFTPVIVKPCTLSHDVLFIFNPLLNIKPCRYHNDNCNLFDQSGGEIEVDFRLISIRRSSQMVYGSSSLSSAWDSCSRSS